METIGVDYGNCNLKTSEGIIFPSKVKVSENLFNADCEVIFEGKKYIVGEGEYDTTLDKTEKENFLPVVCAALGLSTRENIIKVVLGLPINQFKSKKEQLLETISNNKVLKFILNGDQREIIIEEATVYPEGIATYYSLGSLLRQDLKDKEIIILDIGGRTTDIALLKSGKRAISKSTSLNVGMINIYSDLVNEINEKFTLGVTIEDAEGIIKKGLEVDGEKIDTSFMKDIIKNNIDKVFKELNINYPVRTSPILVTGGGGEAFFKSIKKRYPTAILVEDYMFSNAKGLKKVGEKLWED